MVIGANAETSAILIARWRAGRKLGRTLYAETGGADRDADTVLGMVDSPEVAAHIVTVHNASCREGAPTGALHERVAADLRAWIKDGSLPPGAKLPTYRELRQRYGVAQMTVAAAIRALKTEGLIDGQQGRGVFVAARA